MTIDIQVLCRTLVPERTILFFGAGSSIPSNGPSGQTLCEEIGDRFRLTNIEGFNLSDVATIAEAQSDRATLVSFLRDRLDPLQPTGGLLNVHRYPWAGLYTTNYDELIEKSYKRAKKSINVISSNYDFKSYGFQEMVTLYKLHGTISKDESNGFRERLIITASDYESAYQYRGAVFGRLVDQLNTHQVIIIGYSLSDYYLREMINEAQQLKSKEGAPGRIILFIFEKNEQLATIYESRGISVCFGGIDEFFSEMAKHEPSAQLVLSLDSSILSSAPALHPSTIDVATARSAQSGQLTQMFNGRPASYGDIARGWTFERDTAASLETQLASQEMNSIAFVLGAAGVGKTSAVRIALSHLSDRDFQCWEHKGDFALDVDSWVRVNNELGKRRARGMLFVDNAHHHLHEVNKLVERLHSGSQPSLRLVLASSKPHWNPRLKTPLLFENGQEYALSRLSDGELNSLLDLLEGSSEISSLVENRFFGFNRAQRLARLRDKCSADMFVCMKNIFGFQAIDEILLSEFNSLSGDYQSIYKLVCGMEAAGVRVHRELVRRVTGLQANNVTRTLDDLEGIIEEYTVSEREGIFGWKVRHHVIADTITKYKFAVQQDVYDLFSMVVDRINPTYRLEVQSINDMCDLQNGIVRINDMNKQNVILRKMISLAPKENVPRHRLIHNLISLQYFDVAEQEIRIYEKDRGTDGTLQRYKVRLRLAVARHTAGLSDSDRGAMALEASSIARWGVQKYTDDKNMFRSFLETGVVVYKYTGDISVFDEAMQVARDAFQRILDPELRRILSQFSRVGHSMGVNYDL